jgi:hypothetical protein
MDETTAPMPMKKLCIANPEVRCSSGSISPTKARKGSMETLIDASSIQSMMAAIQSAVTLGKIKRAREARIAPAMK